MTADLGYLVVLIFAVFWAVLMSLVLVATALGWLARWVRGLLVRWAMPQLQREKARAEQAEALLVGARRRERMALNLLADLQALKQPFPDLPTAAGSLGDEVEAWLATNPEQ